MQFLDLVVFNLQQVVTAQVLERIQVIAQLLEVEIHLLGLPLVTTTQQVVIQLELVIRHYLTTRQEHTTLQWEEKLVTR